MKFSTRTNGKLLLTGEYFVTEGAVALALPTKLGQRMEAMLLTGRKSRVLLWQSYDEKGSLWFEAEYSLADFSIQNVSEGEAAQSVAEVLQDILLAVRALNPDFLRNNKKSVAVETYLEFPRTWGLGSSSTLVAMIAQWAKVDAFQLLDLTMGGSGYDIAAATAQQPILFQKFNGRNRYESARFNPAFKDNLYFVHLGRKQDSREAMVYYKVTPPDERHQPIGRISQITHNINAYIAKGTSDAEILQVKSPNGKQTVQIGNWQAPDFATFESLIAEHEQLVQSIIKQPRAKDLYFNDFWGEIKSLGAWGGDFVLATSDRSEAETREYFQHKGFDTVLRYDELIQQQ